MTRVSSHIIVILEFILLCFSDKAYLQYDILDPKTKAVDLQHTVVPEAFRGQGIAKVLAKVREQGTASAHFLDS